MTSRDALDPFVERAQSLYSLPAVAMEVLRLTNNPKVDVPALKQCLENDPALTTKILRVVNSSLFGLSREVNDLNQALALLGTKPLKLLVLGFSLPDALFAGVADGVLGRYWQHTLTKAVAAREISETFWKRSGDESFIAGLLQDLGLLVLLQDLGEPYVTFLETIHEKGADVHDLELRSLGFDHTQLSARLLETWSLPESLTASIPASRDASALETGDESLSTSRQILHLAEMVATMLCDSQSAMFSELLSAGQQYCSMSRGSVEEMIETLQAKVEQLADVLSLRLPDGLDYRDVLVQAHSQLSSVASETAEEMVASAVRAETADDDVQSLLGHVQSLSAAAAQAARRPAGQGRAAPPEAPSSAVELPQAPTATSTEQPRGNTAAGSVAATSMGATAVTPDALFGAQLQIAVERAASVCRQQRCALSLLLVEVDRYDELTATRGPRFTRQLTRILSAACQGLNHAGSVCVQLDERRSAVVLPDCERPHAVDYGELLVRTGPALFGTDEGSSRPVVTLSVGVATVSFLPKNFVPDDLFERTERCLYGAHASGGNTLKSIEII